jgi:nitrite reductase (NO-forming)
MLAVQPDFVVFNGAADQYLQQPLTAAPGELIRLYVMNAGPTLFSAFHVIGAIFDRVYTDGNPANVSRGISTWTIPPGGGATFELVIPEAGQYPFVTHSFAYTGLGAVGVINVK